MECLIPLSVLSKLGKFGVKQHKPYNDAKKLLPEKYGLEIVEDEEVGKAIRIPDEEAFLKFFDYFVVELLGRGEAVGQRITYEGVPLEKYEALYRDLLECERDKSLYYEKLRTTEKLVDTLERDLKEETKEKMELKKKLEELQARLRELEKEKKRRELRERVEKILENLPENFPQRKDLEKILKDIEDGRV
jgi:hypothetical protein